MFRRKMKRDERIVELIKQQRDIHMRLANESLDRANEEESERLKEVYMNDYYFQKGRFSMAAGLLQLIEEGL